MRVAAWLFAWLAAAAPAGAAVISAGPESVAVTIYRDSTGSTEEITDPDSETEGLALVTEVRTVDLPAGPSQVVFRGVADGMLAQTAKVEGLPAPIDEQNLDYDLLTPATLFARSVGKTVRLIRTDKLTGRVSETRAIIRSTAEGVVLDIDGRIEALGCAGLAERLVFDDIPDGLTDKPALSLETHAPVAGRYRVKLSYLARGLDWSADYVARINPDGRTLDLSGWITLVNKSGADFANAPLAVVAGKLNRVEATDQEGEQRLRDDRNRRREVRITCWSGDRVFYGYELPDAPSFERPGEEVEYDDSTEVQELVVTGSRIPDMRRLGDYKLYAVPEPTTIAPHQIKQVALLERKAVAFQRVYRLDHQAYGFGEELEDQAVDVILKFKNDRASNLGLPLPAGVVTVMAPDGRGGAAPAGEDRIEDLPVGLPAKLLLGGAMDVHAEARVIRSDDIERGDADRTLSDVEVVITNQKSEPIVFELRYANYGPVRIVRESHRHGMVEGRPTWTLRIRPGGRETVRYTAEEDD